MDRTTEPFTFLPPVHRRGLQLALGALISLVAVGAGTIGAAVVWLPRALSYNVDGDRLVVTSGMKIRPKEWSITLSDIESARAVQLTPGKRVAGTALPGYCAGHYLFPDLGHCTLASTCQPEAVVVEISGWTRSLVITPGHRQAFLEALSGDELYNESVVFNDYSSGTWLGLRAMTAVGVVATLIVPLLFFLSPSRLRYRVTPGHVEVDLTFGAKRFSVTNCLARRYNPETASKVIGSSLPGYHSGRFSLDGMSTRVYATRLTDGVLIESPDLRLFLNPEDPHAFLEALRALGNMEIE